jgi:hypothetical protein
MEAGLVTDDFSAEHLLWDLLAPVAYVRRLYLHLWRLYILGNSAAEDADSQKPRRLKAPQVAYARELEPLPLDTQALPVWRYALALHCGEGGAQIAL